MTNHRTARPQAAPAAAHADQRDRAARLRDTSGRFTKSRDEAPLAPETAVRPEPQKMAPSGTVPAPADAPDDAYALSVNDDSLGMHADRGSCIIVAPEMPTGAGLAVFYLKGRSGSVVYDLTHGFRPEHATAFAPGSELMPLIEVVVPGTGQTGGLRADLVEKIHRVIGVYTPVEVAENLPPKLLKLPVLTECPEGMGEQYVSDAVAYPLVRKGETVVYDPSRREPTHGALCVMQWSNDTRSVMLTDFRRIGGQGVERWWVAPVNRPPARLLYTSDGPYSEDALREKIVGTVVGVLVSQRAAEAAHEPKAETVSEPTDAADEFEETEDSDDTELLRLGRLFEAARARDLAACSAINDVEGAGEHVTSEIEAEAEEAGDLAAGIAGEIAGLPAHTAAGLRVKLRALCHYDPASWMRTGLPELPDPDQRLYFSLRQDIEREADASEVVTVENAAPLHFDAYEFETALRSPQEWVSEFAHHAIGMHVADKAIRMAKPELVAFVAGAAERSSGADEAMYKALTFAQEAFEGWAKFLDAAALRYLVAASAVTVEREAHQAESKEA